MAKRKKQDYQFPQEIVVRHEDEDEGYDLIVGEPCSPDKVDAETGQQVAVYELSYIATFVQSNRLEQE